jgi:hypothetical protein
MWLAEHPLNRARESRRLPPLNALWLWGGARAAAVPTLPPAAGIASLSPPDAWLTGMAAQLQCEVIEATGWEQLRAATPATSLQQLRSATPALSSVPARDGQAPPAAMIVVAADADSASGHYWQMMEQQWFAPISRAMQAGALSGLRLQIGRAGWVIPPRSAFAWLRRRRHFAELILGANP